MGGPQAYREDAQLFAEAVAGLGDIRLRPEVSVQEAPAPTRIAPYALALSAEVHLIPASWTGPPPAGHDAADPVATGRFIVLHDPSGPEAWEGTWRIVSYARATMEAELASEPLLGEVGWSWLTETMDAAGVPRHAIAGTVTRVVSQSFAALADRPDSIELEVRASWTPRGDDLVDQLHAWTEVLCTIGGLPPLPSDVAVLPRPRR
ncbi:MAG TPA: DUF3000 domain-containing protein [Dermatophilaceae bacterium]|nr:DUF3000 domain-containing protein [Dermatophilaceae bacterium]